MRTDDMSGDGVNLPHRELACGAGTVLRSGDHVTIDARREGRRILARKHPDVVRFSHVAENRELAIGEVEPGSSALYVACKQDAFRDAMARRQWGPQGYRPGAIDFHLVLWDGRLAWISSEDAVIRRVADG